MGLDIHISTDKDKEVYSIDFFKNEKDFRYKMSLSRDFCNLMCRQHVSTGATEFEQIAKLTGIDISPIFEMETYLDDESADLLMPFDATEQDRLKMLSKIQADIDKLNGNIESVFNCVESLLDKLASIDNLDNKLIVHGDDTIGIDYYFSDFDIDKGDGYIGNNFGQDLRNFKRFLEYAKSRGETTVYFNYG
jgi:hypothetical protein